MGARVRNGKGDIARRSSIESRTRWLVTGYIDLNPVRAGIVGEPASYRYSSYRANALGTPDIVVKPHAAYLELGRTEPARQAEYRRFVAQRVPVAQIEEIRSATRSCLVLGGEEFKRRIEGQTCRPLPTGRRGRPPKGSSGLG